MSCFGRNWQSNILLFCSVFPGCFKMRLKAAELVPPPIDNDLHVWLPVHFSLNDNSPPGNEDTLPKSASMRAKHLISCLHDCFVCFIVILENQIVHVIAYLVSLCGLLSLFLASNKGSWCGCYLGKWAWELVCLFQASHVNKWWANRPSWATWAPQFLEMEQSKLLAMMMRLLKQLSLVLQYAFHPYFCFFPCSSVSPKCHEWMSLENVDKINNHEKLGFFQEIS